MNRQDFIDILEAAVLYDEVMNGGLSPNNLLTVGKVDNRRDEQGVYFRLASYITIPTKVCMYPHTAIGLLNQLKQSYSGKMNLDAEIGRLEAAAKTSWVPDALADAKAHVPLMERKAEKATERAGQARLDAEMPLAELVPIIQKMTAAHAAADAARERVKFLEGQVRKFHAIPPNIEDIEARLVDLRATREARNAALVAFNTWVRSEDE